MNIHINRGLRVFLSMLTVLVLSSQVFGAASKPMPPNLTYENKAVDILRTYPLGMINELEAFAHHGGPIRKITLPNGNQGWIYKSGENVGVPSLYILQFSNEGVVIDVLHKDYHYKNGHSALQYQFLEKVEVERRTLGPKPE